MDPIDTTLIESIGDARCTASTAACMEDGVTGPLGEFVGEETQCPVVPSIWWIATGECNKMGFVFASEFALVVAVGSQR